MHELSVAEAICTTKDIPEEDLIDVEGLSLAFT